MRRRNASSTKSLGIEVGGEDQQLLKRHLDLFAGVQGQIIDAAFEGDDPAIEQIVGIDPLAAEVVDDQGAAVGFHLKRRFVEARGLTVDQVHGLNRHFAADDDDRPLDPDPALVVALGAGDWNRLMVVQIEDFDHLPVDFDGVRNPDLAVLGAVQRQLRSWSCRCRQGRS